MAAADAADQERDERAERRRTALLILQRQMQANYEAQVQNNNALAQRLQSLVPTTGRTNLTGNTARTRARTWSIIFRNGGTHRL